MVSSQHDSLRSFPFGIERFADLFSSRNLFSPHLQSSTTTSLPTPRTTSTRSAVLVVPVALVLPTPTSPLRTPSLPVSSSAFFVRPSRRSLARLRRWAALVVEEVEAVASVDVAVVAAVAVSVEEDAPVPTRSLLATRDGKRLCDSHALSYELCSQLCHPVVLIPLNRSVRFLFKSCQQESIVALQTILFFVAW